MSTDRNSYVILEIPNLEVVYENGNTLKLLQDRLQMLYFGRLVHVIFELVLVTITTLSPDVIYENSGLTQVFLKKDFQFGLSKGQ